jgi:hypothetical protein
LPTCLAYASGPKCRAMNAGIAIAPPPSPVRRS